MTNSTTRDWLLALFAAISATLYLLIASVGNLRENLPDFFVYYGLAFGVYAIAVPMILRAENSTKSTCVIILLSAVLFRLMLLASPPSLSDDIYRYVWDARVASSGVNPFRYPPEATELAHLRDDEIYQRINHKHIPTVYPPVNQIIFQTIHKIHPSLIAFKVAALFFDLLTMLAVFLILRHLGIPLARGLIYAWNPLVIVEFSGSGHADIIGIFFLTLSLLMLFRNMLHGVNVALALSVLSKFYTAMLWPFFFFSKKIDKRILAAIFVLVLVALYLPYAAAGKQLFAGLLVYGEKWQSNASVFAVVFSAVTFVLPEKLILLYIGYPPDATTFQTRSIDLALLISKIIMGIIFAGICVYFLRRLKKDEHREGDVWPAKLGLILVGSFFLLSPTVQPWYLCWLMPFLVIFPNRAWLLLTGLAAVSYWNLIQYDRSGIWIESWWVRAIEYGPFYLLLIGDFLKSRWQQIRKGAIS